MNKFIKLIFLITLVLIGYFAWDRYISSLGHTLFQGRTQTLLMSELIEMKEINKLYTMRYLVPVLDMNVGELKRDVYKKYIPGTNDAEKVVLGYCLKKYDIGIGYDNVLEILQDETIIRSVCSGRKDKLPNPKILSANSRSSEIGGKYTGECNNWDNNKELRQQIILKELEKGDSLKNINSHSITSLYSLASLLCD